MSVRLKLALSYAAFLVGGIGLLLAIVWLFLMRDAHIRIFLPDPENLKRALDLTNYGPLVFGPAATIVLGFVVLMGVLGGWILAGRMLAPLTLLSQATVLAASGSLTHRVSLSGRRDEFRDLADSFDAMLGRLEAHVAEQQRFAANASHELRTPLTLSQTLLEVARSDPKRDVDLLIDRLQTVNARAIALTEALLVLSRADQGSFAREPVDLSFLVEDACETLLPLAEGRGVTLNTFSNMTMAHGSQALLLQLTTNLIHNAIVHNLQRCGFIWIRTFAGVDGVGLCVENTGPALPSDVIATLGEPFQRAAVRTRGDHAGLGLGLAIAKSIVRAHGGTLALRARSGGGLRVTVKLPTAQLRDLGTPEGLPPTTASTG